MRHSPPLLAALLTLAAVVPPLPAAAAERVIVIRPDNTLFGLAKRYGVTVEALCSANHIAPCGKAKLKPGQKLTIPDRNGTASEPDSAPVRSKAKGAKKELAAGKRPLPSKRNVFLRDRLAQRCHWRTIPKDLVTACAALRTRYLGLSSCRGHQLTRWEERFCWRTHAQRGAGGIEGTAGSLGDDDDDDDTDSPPVAPGKPEKPSKPEKPTKPENAGKSPPSDPVRPGKASPPSKADQRCVEVLECNARRREAVLERSCKPGHIPPRLKQDCANRALEQARVARLRTLCRKPSHAKEQNIQCATFRDEEQRRAAAGKRCRGQRAPNKAQLARCERRTSGRDTYMGRPAKPGYISIRSVLGSYQGYPLTRSGTPVPGAHTALDKVLASKATGGKIRVHPRLIQVIVQLSDHFGGRPLWVASGFRPKPAGQQRSSKHNSGQAADLVIPGVPNEVLRDYCRTLPKSGCGYYPNSTFVHVDVREQSVYWIDYSGPGEAPRYASAGYTGRATPEELRKELDTRNKTLRTGGKEDRELDESQRKFEKELSARLEEERKNDAADEGDEESKKSKSPQPEKPQTPAQPEKPQTPTPQEKPKTSAPADKPPAPTPAPSASAPKAPPQP